MRLYKSAELSNRSLSLCSLFSPLLSSSLWSPSSALTNLTNGKDAHFFTVLFSSVRPRFRFRCPLSFSLLRLLLCFASPRFRFHTHALANTLTRHPFPTSSPPPTHCHLLSPTLTHSHSLSLTLHPLLPTSTPPHPFSPHSIPCIPIPLIIKTDCDIAG